MNLLKFSGVAPLLLLLLLHTAAADNSKKKALDNHIDDTNKKEKVVELKKSPESRKKALRVPETTEGVTERVTEAPKGQAGPSGVRSDLYNKDTLLNPLNPRHRLREHLLQGHPGVNVHPVKNHSASVRVDIGMALIHLDLDERASVLEVDGWMRLNWTDEYLTWHPEDFNDLKQIHFSYDEIWRPDIQLYNNADSSNMQHYGATHLLVFSTGVVLWVPPAKFRAFCKVDLRQWPHDRQTCKLKFGSWTSHGDQIDLGLYHNMATVDQLNFYTANKEWEVTSAKAGRSEHRYNEVEETYPDITFTFELTRTSPSYRAAIVLPCLLTMLLVVSSFLLPPTAGEKVVLNAVCFLVCCVYLVHLQSSLPAMADHIPLILLFYSNTAALVAIAILLNVSCISMARERRYSSPPKVLRTLFSGFLGRLLCLGSYYHQVSDTHHRLELQLDTVSMSESPESEQAAGELNCPGPETSSVMRDWILVAAGIERFFLMVYALAFGLVSSVYL